MFYILHVNYATRAVQRIMYNAFTNALSCCNSRRGYTIIILTFLTFLVSNTSKKIFFAVVVRPRLVYTYRYIHNCILITWPHGNLWLKMDWCWKMYGIIWILFDFSLKHGNLACSHLTNRHVALFWTNGRGDLSKILINKKTNILKQNQIRQSS